MANHDLCDSLVGPYVRPQEDVGITIDRVLEDMANMIKRLSGHSGVWVHRGARGVPNDEIRCSEYTVQWGQRPQSAQGLGEIGTLIQVDFKQHGLSVKNPTV